MSVLVLEGRIIDLGWYGRYITLEARDSRLDRVRVFLVLAGKLGADCYYDPGSEQDRS